MTPKPPRHALNFLRWFCKEDYVEEIEGDLTEIFEKQYPQSARKAKWRFILSVLCYFRPAFLKIFGSRDQPDPMDAGRESASSSLTQNVMKPKRLIVPVIALAIAVAFLIPFMNKALTIGASKPQEPSQPFPYHAENVTFENREDAITLAGTLTLPSKVGVYPAVILISGSGPQNRDEEFKGHRPFLVLADHLTKKGIAVLRYDDRGTGKSEGNFMKSGHSDFASDVKSAIAYLQSRNEIDHNNIGLIGHSEGGILAPTVATSSNNVSFIVMLAGPGIRSTELLSLQSYVSARAGGATEAHATYLRQLSFEMFDMLVKYGDKHAFAEKVTEYVNTNWDKIKEPTVWPSKMTKEKYITGALKMAKVPWFMDLLAYDPAPVLESVHCPVLALIGEKDLQVPPQENLSGISDALARGGNTNVIVKELPGLNHLFQECETGTVAEYAGIEQTFSPLALEEISEWVLAQVEY